MQCEIQHNSTWCLRSIKDVTAEAATASASNDDNPNHISQIQIICKMCYVVTCYYKCSGAAALNAQSKRSGYVPPFIIPLLQLQLDAIAATSCHGNNGYRLQRYVI